MVFLNRNGAEIGCYWIKNAKKIIFYYWKISKIPKVPSSGPSDSLLETRPSPVSPPAWVGHGQHLLEVLHDDIAVVVRLEDPVVLAPVLGPHPPKALLDKLLERQG